ncbi:hypothetical protein PR048_028519 [Dryococelus australis]|uniref:Uncharacterized protein n=1 Tax=Dryococelus australis TaxID=614101 RepID=A0ABQ9GAT7_9NEOP|nr:hypothetical protein PR048_028519 [Dryococelus australis]
MQVAAPWSSSSDATPHIHSSSSWYDSTLRKPTYATVMRQLQLHMCLTRNSDQENVDWNTRAGETREPRETPLACGIVQHDSHMRKCGNEPAGDRARVVVVGGERPSLWATAASILSVYKDMAMAMGGSGGQAPCMLHAFNVRKSVLPWAEQTSNTCYDEPTFCMLLLYAALNANPPAVPGRPSSLISLHCSARVRRLVIHASGSPPCRVGDGRQPDVPPPAVEDGGRTSRSRPRVLQDADVVHNEMPTTAQLHIALMPGSTNIFPDLRTNDPSSEPGSSLILVVLHKRDFMILNLRFVDLGSKGHDGNTARLACRSDEALGVCVTVARIAPSLLDLGRAHRDGPTWEPHPEKSAADGLLNEAARNLFHRCNATCREVSGLWPRTPRVAQEGNLRPEQYTMREHSQTQPMSVVQFMNLNDVNTALHWEWLAATTLRTQGQIYHVAAYRPGPNCTSKRNAHMVAEFPGRIATSSEFFQSPPVGSVNRRKWHTTPVHLLLGCCAFLQRSVDHRAGHDVSRLEFCVRAVPKQIRDS